MDLKILVRDHIWAVGPISFANIMSYCKEQYTGKAADFEVAHVLTTLIREGSVILYDDGVSFYPG